MFIGSGTGAEPDCLYIGSCPGAKVGCPCVGSGPGAGPGSLCIGPGAAAGPSAWSSASGTEPAPCNPPYRLKSGLPQNCNGLPTPERRGSQAVRRGRAAKPTLGPGPCGGWPWSCPTGGFANLEPTSPEGARSSAVSAAVSSTCCRTQQGSPSWMGALVPWFACSGAGSPWPRAA